LRRHIVEGLDGVRERAGRDRDPALLGKLKNHRRGRDHLGERSEIEPMLFRQARSGSASRAAYAGDPHLSASSRRSRFEHDSGIFPSATAAAAGAKALVDHVAIVGGEA
jgi:hypothetical protein